MDLYLLMFLGGAAIGVTVTQMVRSLAEHRRYALDSRVAELIRDESSLTHWQLIVSAALGKSDSAPPNKRK